MMKRIIALLVVLALFVMINPVGAAKPISPPSEDWQTMCNQPNPGIPWNAICYLKMELLKLDERLDNMELEMKPVVIKHGEAKNSDRIYPPDGFELSDCDIIVRPKETVYLAIRYGNPNAEPPIPEQDYHAISFSFIGVENFDLTNWQIFADVNYAPDTSGGTVALPKPARYTVICQK